MADNVSSEGETPVLSTSTPQQPAENAGDQETASVSQLAAAASPSQQQPQPTPPAQPAAVQIDVNQMANVISVSYLAANGLNNQRNRGGGGVNFGVGGPGQNIMNMRNRLFHAIYFKVAIIYDQMFPKPFQRVLEYFFLIKAMLFFSALVYIHMSFIKNPATCLEKVKDWPRDGVLRVEIIPNLDQRLEIYERSQVYENSMRKIRYDYFYGIGPKTKNQFYHHQYATNETYTYYLRHESTYADYLKEKQLNNDFNSLNYSDDDDEQYIVEYSLEYGHLRLSPATRKRLKIPVRVVQLDPLNNKCFGDKFSKFLLKELLGYDDLLMASVRVIAEQEENKGYLRNVITGEHYRFVSTWWTAWSSYPTAFFVMLLFTFSISMLLRFSHHQIFVFIVDLLQMLEFNVTARFPIAPLLIVILALVGMEAIMSEFFNDTTTAFYIILIVWVADQYDAICCHTTITKRHWLRFFYLYHFAFYAYHYRFSGQNRSLALVSSWLFIQHSMLYFFHHYELPIIMQQAQVILLNRNQNDGNGAGAANIVAGLMQRQQQQQGQANRNVVVGQQPGTFVANRIFRLVPLQQQQQAQQYGGDGEAAGQQAGPGAGQVVGGLQPQQLPFVGGLLQHYAGQNVGGALGIIRRALFARGWRQPIRVRIQTAGNLQRINLGSIQINPENLSRVSPTATPTLTPTLTTTSTTTTTATPQMETSDTFGAAATNSLNIAETSTTNSIADLVTSPANVSSRICNASDVETNQGIEYQNPNTMTLTSIEEATANGKKLAAQETETLKNTQTENKDIEQEQQEKQLDTQTNHQFELTTKAAKSANVTALREAGTLQDPPENPLKSPDAVDCHNANQVDVCMGSNAMESIWSNDNGNPDAKSCSDKIITTDNNAIDSGNVPRQLTHLNNKDEHDEQQQQQQQQQQHARISKENIRAENSNSLEKQKTKENKDGDDDNEGIKGFTLMPLNATYNAKGGGGHGAATVALATAAIDRSARTGPATNSTAIQNERKQIEGQPEMIDDETANKSVTTPSSSSSLSATTTTEIMLVEGGPATATAAVAIEEANKTDSQSSTSSTSSNSNSNISTSYSNSSPIITSLSMEISSVEPITTSTITTTKRTTTSLANIVPENHNQSLNLTAGVSTTASRTTTSTSSITSLMSSDVPSSTTTTTITTTTTTAL